MGLSLRLRWPRTCVPSSCLTTLLSSSLSTQLRPCIFCSACVLPWTTKVCFGSPGVCAPLRLMRCTGKSLPGPALTSRCSAFCSLMMTRLALLPAFLCRASGAHTSPDVVYSCCCVGDVGRRSSLGGSPLQRALSCRMLWRSTRTSVFGGQLSRKYCLLIRPSGTVSLAWSGITTGP